MAAAFVLDANFFIQAHRMYYPMDVFPNFWIKVKELADRGIITSIDKVRDEIILNKDDLTSWCELNLRKHFFVSTATIVEKYIEVITWANTKGGHYNAAALTEFCDASEADAWLVAFAMATGSKIVTHETSEPTRKSKVKYQMFVRTLGSLV